MEPFDEMLAKLRKLEIYQLEGDWAENLPKEIWVKYFYNNFQKVKHGLLIDTHRWYETSVTVIKIYDRFLGIRHITNLFSENMSYEDCMIKIEFFEMEEKTVVTYVIKK